jgi:hypothetical protein
VSAFSRYKGEHLVACLVLLALVVFVGIRPIDSKPAVGWLLSVVMMTALLSIAGHAATGMWRGFLIDARNQMSLSRLQIVGWTIIVLTGFLSSVLRNVADPEGGGAGADSVGVAIPPAVWMLLGIGTTSLVVAPSLSRSKARKVSPKAQAAVAPEKSASSAPQDSGAAPVSPSQIKRLLDLRKGVDTQAMANSVVLAKRAPSDAEWRDLIMGEETGNGDHLDIAKVQMLLFTVVVWVAYGSSVYAMFTGESEVITSLPDVSSGLVTLIGISHTGYLADKATTHTPDARPPEEA